MARPTKKDILTIVPIRDLEEAIDFFEASACSKTDMKVLAKLRFVRLRYQGFTVHQASEMMGICIQTGYNWQNQWNRGCYGTIIPGKSPGRPSTLSDDQVKTFADIVVEKRMNTTEARDLLAELHGVSFSLKHVGGLLRSQGLKYVKVDDRIGGPRCRSIWVRRRFYPEE